MKRFRKRIAVWLTLLVLTALASGACGKSREGGSPGASGSPSNPGGTSRPRQASAQTPFEQDLQYVRNGQFNYILVFSRKDNNAFDKDDISYLKANSPKETNQWVRTEQGRRIIAGSNFEFTQEHMDALRQRFNVEDYSGK
jgi:hypothetical protein